MIDAIRRMCHLLCTENVTVAQVVAGVGVVVEDYGGNSQVVVRPSDASFSQAEVGRAYGTGAPSGVRLVPADDRPLSIGELRSAFGDYSAIPKLHFDSPPTIIFHAVERASDTLSCSLVVEVRPGARGIEDGTVAKINIRRDQL